MVSVAREIYSLEELLELKKNLGKVSAANKLGISVTSLYSLIKEKQEKLIC